MWNMTSMENTPLTIPNLITIARLIAVPVIVLLVLNGEVGWAFVGFVLAGLSDAVDGAIARHVPGQASELGRLLDPIADKALLVSLFIVLAVEAEVPVWLAILVVSRDMLIVGGVILSWVADRPVPIVPLMVSKANTAAQIVYVTLALSVAWLGWQLGWAVDITAIVVAVLTVVSAAAYLRGWLRDMQG